MKSVLFDFVSIRPKYESKQAATLKWLLAGHLEAERKKASWQDTDQDEFAQMLQGKISKGSCKEDKIATRGHVIDDFHHENWDDMQVYTSSESGIGLGIAKRLDVFAKEAIQVFEKLYENVSSAPEDLLHVSCTGYVHPNAAQSLVGSKNWNTQTTVTNVYHMGCFGALSAIRVARGYCAVNERRTDIVHTEMCSLHSDLNNHNMDQIVAQSLFSDGFIKYSALSKDNGERGTRYLEIKGLHEEIIPNSKDAMLWNISEFGFSIFLDKSIPVHFARGLDAFLTRLCKNCDLDKKEIFESALFAIHPGGPKILDQIQKVLGLQDFQMKTSREILKKYGNMSSATIPHIWKSLLEDSQVPAGMKIVSLAFGPGLTICGAILEKGEV